MTLVFCPNDCGYFADFCPKVPGYSQDTPSGFKGLLFTHLRQASTTGFFGCWGVSCQARSAALSRARRRCRDVPLAASSKRSVQYPILEQPRPVVIQGQQVFQHFLVGQVCRQAVGISDSSVQRIVHVGKPAWAVVVEIGQGALAKSIPTQGRLTVVRRGGSANLL